MLCAAQKSQASPKGEKITNQRQRQKAQKVPRPQLQRPTFNLRPHDSPAVPPPSSLFLLLLLLPLLSIAPFCLYLFIYYLDPICPNFLLSSPLDRPRGVSQPSRRHHQQRNTHSPESSSLSTKQSFDPSEHLQPKRPFNVKSTVRSSRSLVPLRSGNKGIVQGGIQRRQRVSKTWSTPPPNRLLPVCRESVSACPLDHLSTRTGVGTLTRGLPSPFDLNAELAAGLPPGPSYHCLSPALTSSTPGPRLDIAPCFSSGRFFCLAPLSTFN